MAWRGAWVMVCCGVSLQTGLADEGGESGRFVTGSGASLLLAHTDVDARVAAGVAVVDVVQLFSNPFDQVVDATYVFPLPVGAAVRELTVSCGDRVLQGEIAEREEARRRYEQAAAEGRRAALLEQQRPNMFTQRVSALCPGEEVEVALQYVEPLAPDAGLWSFVFPTTVGPRYGPTPELLQPPLALTTDTVRALTLRLTIEDGAPIGSVWSDSHAIAVDDEGGWGMSLELAERTAPDSDVHVGWTLGGEGIRGMAAVAADPNGGDSTLSLTLLPAVLEDLEPARARELMFVLDSSCSMAGEPWDAAARTVSRALEQLGPDDRFNMVRFSDAASSLFDGPRAPDDASIDAARSWLRRFDGGGTQMERGILHSLSQPGDPEALRVVLLLTDGFIGDEESLFRAVDAVLDERTRIFALGIGTATNQLLLDGLARHGRGTALYQRSGTPVDETVGRFLDRIRRPVMTDVSLRFGDLEVSDVVPRRIGDLWAGQPLRVFVQTPEARDTTVELHGTVNGRLHVVRIPVDLSSAAEREAVTTAAARARIAEVSSDVLLPPDQRRRQVTSIALAHHLVSETTSLIATERGTRSCGPAAGDVMVPALLAEGLDSRFAAGWGGSGRVGWKDAKLARPKRGVHVLGSVSRGSGGGGAGAAGLGGLAQSAARLSSSAGLMVLGSVDRSAVEAGVKRRLGSIQACYARELVRTPGAAGKLVVKFAIANDGTVSAASLKSDTVGSEPFATCVAEQFERMTFAPPGGGGIAIISYPLTFGR